MLDHLKINVTVGDAGHVYGTAQAFADLACHLKADHVDLEITVQPGKVPGEIVTAEHIKALGDSAAALNASADQLDKAVKANAPTNKP